MRIQLEHKQEEESGVFESYHIEWEDSDMVYLFSDNAFGGNHSELQAANMKAFEVMALRQVAQTAESAAFDIQARGGLGDDGTDEVYNDLEIVNYLGWILYESPDSLVEWGNIFASYFDVDTRTEWGNPDNKYRKDDYKIRYERQCLGTLESFAAREFPNCDPDSYEWSTTWGALLRFLLKGTFR